MDACCLEIFEEHRPQLIVLRLHNVQAIKIPAPQTIDHDLVQTAGGSPEANHPAMLDAPRRRGSRPVPPRHRTLPEAQHVADVFARGMQHQPGQLVRRHVQQQDDSAALCCRPRFDERTGRPHLLQRPADLGVAQPEPSGCLLRDLGQMTDRRRTLHTAILPHLTDLRGRTPTASIGPSPVIPQRRVRAARRANLDPCRAGPRRERGRDHGRRRTRPLARRPPTRTRSRWRRGREPLRLPDIRRPIQCLRRRRPLANESLRDGAPPASAGVP